MGRRLLDHDPESGVSTYHHYDPVTNVTHIERVQDVEPMLNLAKEAYKDEDRKKKGIKDSWWHVAQIPVIVQEKWLRDHGVNCLEKDHWPAVRRLLNSPEWRYLRTSPGRI